MRLDASLAAVVLIGLFVHAPVALALEHVHQGASPDVRAWLDFNHHLGGLIVLILAGLTWLELLGKAPSVALLGWPACLLVIGGYNLIGSDKLAWPIGPWGLLDSLSSPEVLQHKMLAVAVLTMGVIELLRRLQRLSHPAWLAVFYGIALLTGILLVLHDGGLSLHLHGSAITTSHVLMGAMALMALVCKMLLDRGVIVGSLAYLYPILLLGLSVQLLLFTDPGGMRP